MKEIIILKSKLFETYCRDVLKHYRDTNENQEWVLFPSDPRDFEQECIPWVSGKYQSAIEEFSEYKQQNEFSSAAVADYMVEEAQAKWLALLELDELTLHEIYFMFRDSIRANESELFFTAVRLSLPTTAVTNAYRYLRIAFELLLWRATASQEEVYLFEAVAFTAQTEYGKYQAIDMCQEKINLKF